MTSEQKIIATKLGLLKLAETLGNVSEACEVMGYSHHSFYRFKELYEQQHFQELDERIALFALDRQGLPTPRYSA